MINSNESWKSIIASVRASWHIIITGIISFTSLTCAFATLPVNKIEQEKPLPPMLSYSFSSSLRVTTNYVWRGISQTDNSAGIQGDLLLENQIGLYTGLFGSNANFMGTNGKPVTSEFQLYAGYEHEIQHFNYNLGLMRYIYPNAVGPDFTEAYFYLGYRIFNVGVARSNEVPDLYGNGGTYHGTYCSAQLLYEIPTLKSAPPFLTDMSFGAHIGRYLFSQDNPRDKNYTDYRLSVSKRYKISRFELSWTDTNGGACIKPLDQSTIAFTFIVTY